MSKAAKPAAKRAHRVPAGVVPHATSAALIIKSCHDCRHLVADEKSASGRFECGHHDIAHDERQVQDEDTFADGLGFPMWCPVTAPHPKHAMALDVPEPALEYAPPPEGSAVDSVRIGDRVHYTHPVQGGPWHGVVIARIDGGYRMKVTKPNGSDLVIEWDATAPAGALDFL